MNGGVYISILAINTAQVGCQVEIGKFMPKPLHLLVQLSHITLSGYNIFLSPNSSTLGALTIQLLVAWNSQLTSQTTNLKSTGTKTYCYAQDKTNNGTRESPPTAHEEDTKDGEDGQHKCHDAVLRPAGRSLDGDHWSHGWLSWDNSHITGTLKSKHNSWNSSSPTHAAMYSYLLLSVSLRRIHCAYNYMRNFDVILHWLGSFIKGTSVFPP